MLKSFDMTDWDQFRKKYILLSFDKDFFRGPE